MPEQPKRRGAPGEGAAKEEGKRDPPRAQRRGDPDRDLDRGLATRLGHHRDLVAGLTPGVLAGDADRTEERPRDRERLVDRCARAAAGAPDLDTGLAAAAAVLAELLPHDVAVLALAENGDALRVAAATAAAGERPPAPGTVWKREGTGSWLAPDPSVRTGRFGGRRTRPEGAHQFEAWAALDLAAGGAGGGALILLAREPDAFEGADLALFDAAGRAAIPPLATLAALEAERRTNRRQREVEELRANLFELVVHELRAPLAGISRLAETLLLAPAAGDANRTAGGLRRIDDLARRMDRSVTRILSTGTVEAGELQVRRRPLDLGALVRQVTEEFRLLEPDRIVALHVPPRLAAAAGDEFATTEILFSLLTNAAKFSPPDAPIGVSLRGGADTAIVTVVDRGPGIAEEDLPRLFGRFVTLGDPPPGGSRGVGLGLYLARRFVEAQGGTIWVERPEQGGARFCFGLPYWTTRMMPSGGSEPAGEDGS